MDVSTECPLGAEELVSSLGEVDILAMTTSPTRLRLVTHYEVTEDDVRHTLARFQEIVLRSTAAEEEAGRTMMVGVVDSGMPASSSSHPLCSHHPRG